MNKTVRNIIIMIAAIIVGFIIFWIFSKPIRADKTRKNDILNFLNGKSTNNISEETLKIYKEISNLDKVERYDISDMIKDYTNKIRKTLKYRAANPLAVSYGVKSEVVDTSNESVIKSYLGSNCSTLLYKFDEKDLSLAGSERFGNELVKKLEKLFTHEKSYAATGWIIDENSISKAKSIGDEVYKWNLPYDVFVEYRKRKISLKDNSFVDVSLKKIKDNEYKLTLIDSNNKTYTTYMTFEHKDSWFHKRDMTINIYDLVSMYQPAKIIMYMEDQENLKEVVVDTDELDGMTFEKVELR